MAQYCEACNTLLICGNITKVTERFNEQTSFKEVFDHIQQAFGTHLPESYRIVYYDPTRMSLIDLEDQLRNKTSPFQINSSPGVRSTTSVTDCLRLYITVNRPVRTESTDEQIASTSVTDDGHSAESWSTSDEISQTNDSLPSFIPQSIGLGKERLAFTLDVKSHQRDIYMSDEFNVRSGRPNGRIARIQGRKSEGQKMLQILPKLRIPKSAIQPNVTLFVAAALEKLKDGKRIWYKHPDKGFLPEIYGRDTEPINPIILRLDNANITSNREFTLSLQMVTKWAKLNNDLEEIYQYDDEKTTELLHRAQTDPKSPRLICVLQQNDQPNWDTFCLSDFIRTPKSSKERSASASPETIDSQKRKRSRHDD